MKIIDIMVDELGWSKKRMDFEWRESKFFRIRGLLIWLLICVNSCEIF